MKKFILNIIFSVCILSTISCGEDAAIEQSETPVFPDLETIALINPGRTYSDISVSNTDQNRFLFNAPSDVNYFVLGLMSAAPEVSGKTITNDDPYWVAGSRSGLEGFSNGTVYLEDLYMYDSLIKNFSLNKITDVLSGSYTGYYWFVLGYDKSGILTHASPAWEINLSL